MVLKPKKVRQHRLESEIKKILAKTFETDFKEQFSSLITISHVELSNDLKRANVFYSVIGDCKELIRIKHFFNRNKNKFKSIVADQLSIRFIPDLVFRYDSSALRAQRVEELIEQIHQKENQDKNVNE